MHSFTAKAASRVNNYNNNTTLQFLTRPMATQSLVQQNSTSTNTKVTNDKYMYHCYPVRFKS